MPQPESEVLQRVPAIAMVRGSVLQQRAPERGPALLRAFTILQPAAGWQPGRWWRPILDIVGVVDIRHNM